MDTNHQPGDVVHHRYRIVRPIGRGGAGTTYEAEDIETGGRVALKLLDVRSLGEWKKLDLFEREARTLKSLVHPAIPRYVDSFQTDDGGPRLYIVQELAPGRSLAELVAGGFQPDEAEVRRIAEKILGVLGYLESQVPPIVHRDIKPQNVLRGEDGEIFLVDFGAVNDVRREGDGSTVVGTYGYMAPEQLRGQATSASDLYGLGATLVFLLARRSPAELPQKKLKIDLGAHVRVSPDFGRWLDRLLEPAPEDRFATAREAALALQGRGQKTPWWARQYRVSSAIRTGLLLALALLVVSFSVSVFRLTPVQRQDASADKAAVRSVLTLNAHGNSVFAVAFAPDGKTLATAGNDRTVKLWNAETGQPIRELPVAGARAVAFTRDGASLLAASDRSILVQAAATGALERTLTGHDGEVTSLAVDAADKAIVSGSLDGTVRVWDRTTGALRQTLPHGGRVLAVAISSDGRTLASAGDDRSVKLWDLGSGALLRALPHGAAINGVAFAPDGQALVSVGDDHTAKVWLVARGERMLTLEAHDSEVWCASIQPDGRSVATGGKDGKIRIWDIYTGKVRRVLTADAKGVLSIATSPSGLVATGGGTGLARLWTLAGTEVERDADVEARDGWTPLHVAAWNGDLEGVKAALAAGTPVDARNALKRTPLYNAAKHGHLAVAAYLVERGADVNATERNDLAPLYPAVERGHREVVELLLAKGADLRHKNLNGQSYLFKAAEQGQAEVAKILIDKGLPINEGDRQRWTPLGIACQSGHARVVELLLAQPGIDLSLKIGQARRTPLMLAAESGNEDIVRQLLRKGVDVNEKASDDETALTVAERHKQRKIAAVLRENGAK